MRRRRKTCTGCKRNLRLSHFSPASKGRPGVRPKCKKCRTAYQTKRRYGISEEEKREMLASQKGKCALCGTSSFGQRAPSVDHCHETNKIRGILCTRCNTGLGHFKDNVETLLKAVAYLEKHNGTKKA